MVLTIDKKEYVLTDIDFEVYSLAMVKIARDKQIEGGKIIFDALYTGKDLIEIQKDVSLYCNICLACSDLIDFKTAKIKKN